MTTDPPPFDKEKLIKHALQARQYGIGLALANERLLESLGHPVDSAIVTRRERRILTRRPTKRKI